MIGLKSKVHTHRISDDNDTCILGTDDNFSPALLNLAKTLLEIVNRQPHNPD